MSTNTSTLVNLFILQAVFDVQLSYTTRQSYFVISSQ